MTEKAPDRPMTDEEKYQSALRKVMALKEKHPELHEAVLNVIGKHVGDCVHGFFQEAFDPVQASNIHARFIDLDKVARVIQNPVPFLKASEKNTQAPTGGGLRSDMASLLATGRRVKSWVREKMKKGES